MSDSTAAKAADDPTGSAAEAATQVYVDHRELLFSIVYNMLGTVADTEDVLQETWLSWTARRQSADADPIEHPRAYLVRIAVNQALARRADIRRRQETYVGPWLPEPLIAPADDEPGPTQPQMAAERSESVSLALLVVLESLSPAERAVFVLHEVFGYSHTDIAGILDRSPAAVRQLAHRAREHVDARRPRYRTDPQRRRMVTERFLAASFGGDVDDLLKVLAPEVTMWTDGGGKAAGSRSIHGRDDIVGLLSSPHAIRFRDAMDIQYRLVNGDPAVLLYIRGGLFAVIVLDLTPDGDQVSGIYVIANPDKLPQTD